MSGIFGTSAGGYGAAHAMLVHPEFYRVGVTISGDHDARLDKAWWNELYQGYPVQDDYVEQSNVTMAEKLKKAICSSSMATLMRMCIQWQRCGL